MNDSRLESGTQCLKRGFASACWVAVIACAAATPLVASAGTSERWTATSTTSMAITGNATFSPQRIRFSNGRVLALSAPEQVASFKVIDEPVEATIYRVAKPVDLKLRKGNHLCGSAGKSRPVTFIVVWKPVPLPGDKESRGMAAFSGDEKPSSTSVPGFCGTYSYQAR
jgi:hypothetical protein